MSKGNLEVVRKLCDAVERDDLDEVLSHCAPDVLYRPAQELEVHGRDAVRASLERWTGDIERLELVAEELLDAGDRVVLVILLRGRGRNSGVEIEARFYEVFTLRDRSILQWEEFTDRSPALEAAGLKRKPLRR
jgi:ketosteroid isomerase-like protein